MKHSGVATLKNSHIFGTILYNKYQKFSCKIDLLVYHSNYL